MVKWKTKLSTNQVAAVKLDPPTGGERLNKTENFSVDLGDCVSYKEEYCMV